MASPKKLINMRLDKNLLEQAKRVLGKTETTETVETALWNLVHNRRAFDSLKKYSRKAAWKGFDGSPKI